MTRARHAAGSRLLTACLCLLVCAGAGRAQGGGESKTDKRGARPDLSGTWVLDKTLTPRDKSSPGGADDSQVTVLISHREPEIKITRKTVSGGRQWTQEAVYYGDGRGETNLSRHISADPDNDSETEIKSETRWKKDKLITETTLRSPTHGTFVTFKITQEWKLSPDGRVLTQTRTIKTDVGEPAPGGASAGTPPPAGRRILVTVDPRQTRLVYRRAG